MDGHKAHLHPHRIAQWLDSRNDWELAKSVYPIYVEVSPMGACNHRCSFCSVDFLGYKPENKWDGTLLRERIREMASLGVKSVCLAGEGEPLLHREINAITLAASSVMDVSFITNGVLLDNLEMLPLAKWVRVSINAGTKETYAKVHRTKEKDWDTVWTNLRDAAKRKGECVLGVQMVCLPENALEEKELQALCDDAGVDYLVLKPYSQHKMSITHQYEGFKPLVLSPGANTIVRTKAMLTEKHEYERCNATPYLWAYAMATGDLYSCSAYLSDPRFNLGNLNTRTFKDVWEGEERRKNWELMKTLDISACRVNCRMQRSNEYLASFDTQPHRNFL